MARSMGAREWAMLVTLAVFWSGSFFFGKVALAELPPFAVLLGRVGLAALLLQLMLGVAGLRLPRDWRQWRAFVAMGTLNNLIPFALILWGQTQIASGLAAILNALTPASTAILAHLLTVDEKLSPAKLAGVLLGFGGVVAMIGPELLSGLDRQVLAELACIAATVSYALAGLFGRRFRHQPPLVAAAGQVTASAVMALPLALLLDQPWQLPAPSLVVWGALLGMATFSTAFGYWLYFRILATAGATNLLLVTFLIPVSAILLGAGILGERLESRQLAGMAVIGLGLAAIDGRILRLRLWRFSLRAR